MCTCIRNLLCLSLFLSLSLSPSLSALVGANVNRRTAANDHTVLSLASAGGHISVVQYLLMKGAEPSYMLRVGSLSLWHTHTCTLSNGKQWRCVCFFVCTHVHLEKYACF